MAKYTDDYVLDGATARIAEADVLHICAGAPISYADVTTRSLGSVAVDGTDFTFANGDVSGRKVTVAAQSGISITTSGSADHVVLINTGVGAERILHMTTMTAQTVTAGNTANVAAWDAEFADVTP